MRMEPVLNTYERVVAWRRVQEKMSVSQIAERLGCCLNSVRTWMRHDPRTLRINKEHRDAFLVMLEDFMQGIRPEDAPPSSDMPIEPAAEKTEPQIEIPKKLEPDHCVEIPVIQKEVVLIALINQELNHLSADRLIAVYRAILSKVL